MVHIHALSHILQQEHGEFSAQMLAKFIQALDHTPPPRLIQPIERWVIRAQLQNIQNPENPLRHGKIHQARTRRIQRVQGKTHRHRRRMKKLIRRHRLQLMRRPVPEIQRPARPRLKRVSTGRNMLGMQQGGLFHTRLQDRRLQLGQGIAIFLNPFKKLTIPHQRDFHRLNQPRTPRRLRLGVEKIEIIDHRIRHGEGAHPIFLPKRIDRAFHTHPAVILRQSRRRKTDQTHTTMRRGRSIAHSIQKCTSADDQGVGMTVQMRGIDRGPNLPDQVIIRLCRLTARENRRSQKTQVQLREIPLNGIDEARPSQSHRLLKKNHRTPPTIFRENLRQRLILTCKRISCENNAVLEGDGNLKIVARHQCARAVARYTLACQGFLPPILTMPPVKTLFESRWLGLYRIGDWDFARRPNSEACVGILAITPAQEIVLVEQFRVPVQRTVIEIPAGLVGDEAEHVGESLASTARRELLEETGYTAGSMTQLIASPTSAGMTSETTHFFHAKDIVRAADGGGVGGENITVHHVPISELRTWLAAQEAAGKAVDFKIHAALWLAGICG